METPEAPRSEPELIALALALAPPTLSALTPQERALAHLSAPIGTSIVARTRAAILENRDPLGDSYCRIRSAVARRPIGAVYTPPAIVEPMLERATAFAPKRIVDPGSGTGRFLLGAARRFPKAELVAVETDPVARLLLRANLAVQGLTARTLVIADDYRAAAVARHTGKTLFLGNPPYVRHHGIAAPWKLWLTRRARELGLRASQLAGLHAHFLLATAHHAEPGDAGIFVMSAEWLDVRYGALLRDLLTGRLGLLELHLLDPGTRPFENADTTAVIVAFEVGARPASVRARRVASLAALAPLVARESISRERLRAEPRWTPLLDSSAKPSANAPELGEYFDVHRGQVTGANRVWIAGEHSRDLPESVLFATVTRARELIRADGALTDDAELRDVIDLPVDLDGVPLEERRRIERFLRRARRMGADTGFIARHRKAWWSVGLRAPAPILVTYMARRPPAFVHNVARARHLNIAHGLYPRERVSAAALGKVGRHLSAHVAQSAGRTYAGGLTKFEPGELLRVRVEGLREILE